MSAENDTDLPASLADLIMDNHPEAEEIEAFCARLGLACARESNATEKLIEQLCLLGQERRVVELLPALAALVAWVIEKIAAHDGELKAQAAMVFVVRYLDFVRMTSMSGELDALVGPLSVAGLPESDPAPGDHDTGGRDPDEIPTTPGGKTLQ